MKKGFTLIELLVVISIIGLLSSVVVTSLQSARANARDSVRVQHLVQIKNALMLYAANNNGAYPAADSTFAGDWNATTKAALVPYLPNMPKDPVLNQAAPGWQGYGFTYCDTVSPNNSCAWLNSPQTGQACPGQQIVWAYNSEGKVSFLQCSATANKLKVGIVQ